MNPKIAVLLVALGIVLPFLFNSPQAETGLSQFQQWKRNHGIKYSSELQEMYRERVFLENVAQIEAHNAKKERAYELGLNKFTALTTQQFAQQYLNSVLQSESKEVQPSDDLRVGDVDWTTQGAVTPVKNQGQCGACWAFSTVASLEGLSKIAYGKLEVFSEQQLIDCSGSYGNMGCNGGLADYAFKYVKDKGVSTEAEYPYKATKQACQKNEGSFKISGFTIVTNCNELANALNSRPITVAVDASNWPHYKSGVFDNCGTRLNYDVLLVGVNAQSWKIKNCWGISWGENGYIRLKRGNTCGVCNNAAYPNK